MLARTISLIADLIRTNKAVLRIFLALAALGAWLGVAGCAPTSLPHDTFHDEFAHWGETHRPAGQPGNLTGLSDEAQQVERNLGVR